LRLRRDMPSCETSARLPDSIGSGLIRLLQSDPP
jgi:hypothetical protein